MVAENFTDCLKLVLVSEGAYSNDAHDSGGPTMHGIIQREYARYRKRKGLPKAFVKHITDHEVHDIYLNDYWKAAGCDDLPKGIDYAHFDAAVNSGVGRAKQWLKFGHDIDQYCNRRLAYLKRLHIWRYFGHSWHTRVEHVRSVAKAMELTSRQHPENECL